MAEGRYGRQAVVLGSAVAEVEEREAQVGRMAEVVRRVGLFTPSPSSQPAPKRARPPAKTHACQPKKQKVPNNQTCPCLHTCHVQNNQKVQPVCHVKLSHPVRPRAACKGTATKAKTNKNKLPKRQKLSCQNLNRQTATINVNVFHVPKQTYKININNNVKMSCPATNHVKCPQSPNVCKNIQNVQPT